MSPTAGAVLLLAFLPLLSIAATYTLSIYLGRYKGNRRTAHFEIYWQSFSIILYYRCFRHSRMYEPYCERSYTCIFLGIPGDIGTTLPWISDTFELDPESGILARVVLLIYLPKTNIFYATGLSKLVSMA
jgi:hypothetical protein